MKKITPADVRGPKLYAGFRDDLRKRVIELKRERRFSVGPTVTLVFENRTTVLFQIEEMCRAESIFAPEKIHEEIEVYNALVPNDGEVSATLFVELTDEETLAATLDSLVGLQDHVWLVIGGKAIKATFDAEQFAADKLAAVQYLRFPIDTQARATLREAGSSLLLRIDHPNYAHETTLSEAGRKQLVADLA